jgi:hypothetical protein
MALETGEETIPRCGRQRRRRIDITTWGSVETTCCSFYDTLMVAQPRSTKRLLGFPALEKAAEAFFFMAPWDGGATVEIEIVLAESVLTGKGSLHLALLWGQASNLLITGTGEASDGIFNLEDDVVAGSNQLRVAVS